MSLPKLYSLIHESKAFFVKASTDPGKLFKSQKKSEKGRAVLKRYFDN
jgi:hypothetical protein